MKKTAPRPLSRDDLRAALFAISPDLDREAWLRVGMALHAELPGDDGAALFDEWSRGGQTYNPRDVRDAWRSFKPGRITVATLASTANRRTSPGRASALTACASCPTAR